ncbi:MAG: GNAT family N-acetyltransferase [Gammaproteobacteria bacterium]|nr:GNAT family N-acetyltransferase [Gammaproteobacteria bacterium]MCP5423681.1 GNAT family N-acetyltransferase [Gammaproteobacteria bacterium]
MNGAPIELAAVADTPGREAARVLITEYLNWIADAAASKYGLKFDVKAMVASDLNDPVKFFPPSGRFYVVRSAGVYVGVGCLKRITPEVGEIQRMYLQPPARGCGAGRRLVEHLLADAQTIGYRAVRLESLKFLVEAHALYRSVGFREIAPYMGNSMQDYQAQEKMDRYRSSAVFMERRFARSSGS